MSLGSCALASCLSALALSLSFAQSAAFALFFCDTLTRTHTHTSPFGELLVTFVFVFPLCAGFSHALPLASCRVLFMYPQRANDKPTVADPAIDSLGNNCTRTLSHTFVQRWLLSSAAPVLLLPSNLHSHCAVAVVLFECNSNWRTHSRACFYVSSRKNKDSSRYL